MLSPRQQRASLALNLLLRLKKNGWTLKEIAAELNNQNIPTVSGKEWTTANVAQALWRIDAGIDSSYSIAYGALYA